MTEIEKVTTRDDDYRPEPPKLFAWLASVVTISLIVASQFLPRGGNSYLRGVGVFILLLAGVFIFWPFYLLAKHGEQAGSSYMQANGIVARGLYAVVRHPQYLGYILLGYGFALLSQHWVAVLLTALGSTLFHLQAVREERFCLAQFGGLYEQYLWRVPRFNIILGGIRLLRGGRK